MCVMKEEPFSIEDRETARAILRYLAKRPKAKDTLEGIAQWWLRPERSKPALGDVARAVTFLLSEGFILETRRIGLPPYYRLNPHKGEDISRILKRSS